MVTKRIIDVSDENSRLILLEDYERKIYQGFRRGLEASLFIGEQLKKINEANLHEERGFETFNEYCLKTFGIEPKTVSRLLTSVEIAKNLKDNGADLPANESQLLELGRLEPARQVVVWERCKTAAEAQEGPVTVDIVRTAVQLAQQEDAKGLANGVRTSLDEPDLDLSGLTPDSKPERSKRPVERSRVSLSEDGEADLERIRRVCGDLAANAIENKTIEMSERELNQWAHHPDPASLRRYIIDLRWSVAKAIGFETQTIDDRTPISKLRELTYAHGGSFEVEVDSLRISLEVPT